MRRHIPLALLLLALLLPSAGAAATPGHHRAPSRHRRATHHRRLRHPIAHSAGVTRAATSTRNAPSGAVIPTAAPRGYHLVFADDFTGSALSPAWKAYWGKPGGDPGGFFDPTHVTVSGGQMVISAFKDATDNAWDAGPSTYVSGGVSTSPSFSQTYGSYQVRMRMDAGVGVAHAILLWPASNTWPPEIDFSEDNGANRQTDFGTLHYGANNTMQQQSVGVDLTKWHTVGVTWSPGLLQYTMDGRVWATMTGSQVPAVPMNLAIQTQGWACGTSTWEQCTTGSTPAHVNLDVDWVVAYGHN